jgi:Ca-activated chloride channel family protein
MLPSAAGARRPEWLDLELTHGSAPLRHASMRLKGPTPEEGTAADIDDGRVRLRLTPGRYGATIEGEGLETIELTGIVHDGSSRTVGIALSASPEVTLEIDPERPVAGNEAHVQFWGAPAGTNWLVLAVTGSPLSDFLVRSPATGRSGEVSLSLPDTPTALEIRFATEVGNGVLQLLGRIAFDSARRRISLRTPEHAEIRTSLTMGWSGDALNGDHVAIDRRGPDGDEPVFCLPVGDGGKLKTTSPNMPGEYVVRYVTRRGRTVARSSIDIFEVLATLDGPTQSPPGVEIEVSWTGPESEQDFLSIASIDEDDEEYMSFTPASSGSPARLTTPKDPGEYELRYVRAADGEVLAREPLAVVAVEIDLEVPPEVGVGTRFEVSWSGTSEPGDFITVAPEGSEPGKKLDSTYASLGSPVSLAAPFKPGRYVVRYISGTSRQIVVEAPIVAR